jgi:hypothetical protein
MIEVEHNDKNMMNSTQMSMERKRNITKRKVNKNQFLSSD